MSRTRLVIVAAVGALCAAAACGPTESAGQDGGPGPDGFVPGHDGGGPGPDGWTPGQDGGAPGVDGSVSADGGATRSYCYQSCTSVADCVVASGAYDADNYSCDNHLCQWQGCNNSQECAESMMDSSYVCGTLPVSPLATCYKSCTTVNDCVLGSSLYDANNYQCTTGLCEWTGCTSSAECADAFMDASYVCGSLPGINTPYCYKGCSTPSDCVTTGTLYDADNYQCTTGLCEWIGCNASSECADAYQDIDYVCE